MIIHIIKYFNMSNSINNIVAASLSSIAEVITTHPLDYAKTLQQNNSFNFSTLIKQPYTGLSSRIVGIIPLRIIYWNSIDYFSSLNYSSLNTGVLTSILQTSVDYPIEQIKINKMLNTTIYFNVLGCCMLLLRNTIFAVIFTSSVNNIEDKRYSGAIGGFFGSLLSHPIDTLKTHYQAGNNYFPSKWTIENYFRGWYYRCGVSLVGMNVGYYTYHSIKEKING